MSDLTVCFVGTRRGNEFMNELLAAVAHEVAAAGVQTRLAYDGFPPIEGRTAYVVVPHEYFELAAPENLPSAAQLSRTISFGVEQPGTQWFEHAAAYARKTAAVMDIQRSSLPELRRRGLHPEHFQIGYTEFWDTWRRDEEVERPIDVVFMGSHNARRVAILGGYARTLWPLESRIFLPAEGPKTRARPNYLVAEQKWELLARTKTVLTVRRDQRSFFEWVRVLEAVSNGCVVVAEHAAGTEPFVPGVHYASGSAESLALLARGLVEDEDGLRRMRLAAYDLARAELPMRPAALRLADLADRLASRPRRPVSRAPLREAAPNPAPRDRVLAETVRSVAGAHGHTAARVDRLAQALKEVALENVRLRRRLDDLRLAGKSLREEVVYESPAWADAQPRVSVLVPVYNHADEVGRALASVAAGDDDGDVEVVVLDDASTDASAGAATAFLTEHPFLPGLVLRAAKNRGVGGTRNVLMEHGRAEYAFMLDADNEVYPTAIGRLVEALDDDRDAVFAYSILEEVTHGKPTGLRSGGPWNPAALRHGNYIDAMSLLRRRRVLELGGYTDDVRLYGWEDFDLWCRIADHGGRGAFVPQILCRYHQGEHSMLTVTNIDLRAMWGVLRKRYPDFMQQA
jgi:hypothetical protein